MKENNGEIQTNGTIRVNLSFEQTGQIVWSAQHVRNGAHWNQLYGVRFCRIGALTFIVLWQANKLTDKIRMPHYSDTAQTIVEIEENWKIFIKKLIQFGC